MQTGITPETVKNIVLDAGAVYINYGDAGNQKCLGATKSGATFTVTREIRDMSESIDGARGPVKGMRRIVREVAKISVTLAEITKENLLRALPGSVSADYPEGTPTHDQITGDLTIKEADYLTSVAIVADKFGTTEPFICLIKNALADGNLEIKTADKDESGLAVEFTAHYDPAELDTPPWEIRNPKVPA